MAHGGDGARRRALSRSVRRLRPASRFTHGADSRSARGRDRYGRKSGQDRIAVIVVDPFSESNGSAFPLLSHPFVVVWATPPESDSGLGSLRDWGEILLAHELGHILHLTRPQNRQPQLFRLLLPFGPLAFAPRWAIEGYATVLEGKITGSGRPASAWRAALLRTWAVEGRLPGYAEMSATGGWIGGSYAYLVGSTFLEWLEAREGAGALLTLWKSATRRGGISFAAAFERTFGRPAPELYARFAAELTAKAIEDEKALAKAGPVEGDTWQRFKGETRAPEISPDGKRLVIERRRPGKPRELLVYTLEPTPDEKEARRKLDEREKKRLEDPEEPRDRPVLPAATEVLAASRGVRRRITHGPPAFIRTASTSFFAKDRGPLRRFP